MFFMHRPKGARAIFGLVRANSRSSQQGKAPGPVRKLHHFLPHFPNLNDMSMPADLQPVRWPHCLLAVVPEKHLQGCDISDSV